MDDELIEAHRDLDALMPYLHLPVQSGSDRVLAAMNRRHSRADYLRTVDRIRAARPGMALAGDFIVGFPGETEADFVDTLGIVDEVGYASAFSFKYSPRPGTPAATMEQVPEPVKAERLARLQAAITRGAGPVQRVAGRDGGGGAVRADGTASGPDRRPLALAVAGAGRRRRRADRLDRARVDHRGRTQQPVRRRSPARRRRPEPRMAEVAA